MRDGLPQWSAGGGAELAALQGAWPLGVYSDDGAGAWVVAVRAGTASDASEIVGQHVVAGVPAAPIAVGTSRGGVIQAAPHNGGLTIVWGSEGRIVSSGAGLGYTQASAVHDEPDGGVFVSWLDRRGDPQGDSYALGLDALGRIRGAELPAAQNPGIGLVRVLPNPARGGVSNLNFALAQSARVELGLFDLAGRSVRRLIARQSLPPGMHGVEWDGRNESGAPVAPGIYFARIDAGDESAHVRLVVTR